MFNREKGKKRFFAGFMVAVVTLVIFIGFSSSAGAPQRGRGVIMNP
jgi:hypothetical protein